jgi:hypothetical protein
VAGHSTFTLPNVAVTLTASATKTLLLYNPATIDAVLSELCVSFDTPIAATGIQIDLYRVVTLGSAAGTTGVLVPSSNPDSTTIPNSTGNLTNLTTEPTTVAVIKSWYIQQSGLLLLQAPLGRETLASKTGGAAVGLRAITPAGVTPKALAYFEMEP